MASPTLRAAVAAEKGVRAGVAIDPERVLVTSGTSPAMLLVFGLLVEPGAEVLIPTPHYPCYPNFVRFCGGVPVFVPTDPASGYQIDVDAVRRAITPRTACLVAGSPANPTGAVQRAETLAALAELGVPLVSDEIYDGLVFDGGTAPSALAASEDVFVLDGFSKRYAMTGFRLGFAIVPPAALRPLQVMQQNLFISANHFVQRAGVAALEHGEATRRAMLEAYTRRRSLLVDGLRKLGFEIPLPPAGAFYVFADARRFGTDSRAPRLRSARARPRRDHARHRFRRRRRGVPAFLAVGARRRQSKRRWHVSRARCRSEDPRRTSRRDGRCARRISRAKASPRSRSSGARTSASRAC